jgi:hypothetical protein
VFKLETQAGKPIVVGNAKIIPLAQVLQLQPPGSQGGLIWNRPAAVRVEREDGSQELIPIYDVTCLSQIILAGLVAGTVIFWVLFKIIRRKQ